MKGKLWQDWFILAASGWLFFSPIILGYATLSHPAAWVAFVCATVLFLSASEALVVPDMLEEWVDGGIGIALMASPAFLDFRGDTAAAVNTFVVGMSVTVFATLALIRDIDTSVAGHHWTVPG